MLLLKFLKLITEESTYEEGKQLYRNGAVISYSEKKALEDVYDVEAKVLKDGKTFTLSLFINRKSEVFSQLNCNCYYYATCSHIIAAVFKFCENHKMLKIDENEIPQKYDYAIYDKKGLFFLSTSFEEIIDKWIEGEIKFNEDIKAILETLSYYERAVIYELKYSNDKKLTNELVKALEHVKINGIKMKTKKQRYEIDIENNHIKLKRMEKIEIDTKKGIFYFPLEERKLEIYRDKEVYPEILFDILPSLQKEMEIRFLKSVENYVLEEKIADYILKFEEQEKKIYIIPEINIEGRTYQNLEILTIDMKYKKISEFHWKKIDDIRYKEFIAFLKCKNLKATKHGFLCSHEFFSDEYKLIPSYWKKVGIKNVVLEGEAKVNIKDKKGSVEISYNLNDDRLSDTELKEIVEDGFIKKGKNLYFVENKKEILTETKVEDRKENLMCFIETIRDRKNLNIKNSIMENIKIPDKFASVLRNYQKDGFKWMYFLHQFKFGGILADDMGIGKTIQTLALIEAIEEKGRFLIVVPKSLLFNWKDEINKFLKTDDYLIYDGEKQKREKLFESIYHKKIIVTSYSILKQDYEELKDVEFLYLILDEAQHIKNYETVIWRQIKGLKSKFRLALTGTPIENSLKELWAIFEFIMPEYLGKYEKYTGKGGVEEIKYRTMPFILRRTKSEVLKELPEKIEQVVRVELYPKQKKLYDSILDEMRKKIDDEINKVGIKKSYFTILSALTYLREVCNHPELVGRKNIFSSKVDLFEEIVGDAVEGGHKVLVFSQFVRMLEILERSLKAKNIKYEVLTGSTKDRMDVVNRFNNNEEIKVFLISLKAGGVGLNLTSADTVIHIDPWWNPMVERQATDRVHRIGQTKTTNVYKIITKETIEEKILDIQERKKELFDNLINSNSEMMKDITIDDLKKLFE